MIDRPQHVHTGLNLGRSEYFYTMLNSDFIEGKQSGPIPIQDTTKEAFSAMLQYLYTDEVDLADSNVLDVLRLAHRCQLTRLCQECCVYVRRTLNVQNAVSWWVAAKDFFMEDVTEQAFEFVKQNFKRIRCDAPSTLCLLDSRPELMKDLLMHLPM